MKDGSVNEKSELAVVVIDDSETFRSALIASLAAMPGVTVVGSAGSAMEGLSIARLARPHLVLVDVSLPDGDGIEVARVLRMERPRMRVVVVTLHEHEVFRELALAAGADAFVGKSKLASELDRVVQDATQEHRGREQCSSEEMTGAWRTRK